VDFNRPIEYGVISNDSRIRSTNPSIQKMDQGASSIRMSHLGRPKGVVYDKTKKTHTMEQAEFSLRPVTQLFEQLLKSHDPNSLPVLFADDCMDAQALVDQLKPQQVVLLENARFYTNESSKNAEERLVMARHLTSNGDYFCSDAFGTAHRDSATMTGIP
jgi:phosphoglycerate kinase